MLLEVEPGGRYLRRSVSGEPFPLFIDSSWESARLQASGWQEYYDEIAARGFTTVFVQGALPLAYDPGDDYSNPYFNATVSSGVYDITQPNAAAFANIRAAILYAQSKGLQVIFFPAYIGYIGASPVEGILDALLAATGDQVEAYGAYCGALISDIPGVIVALGGDGIPDATGLERIRRLVVGLTSTDSHAGRLYTYHAARGQSSYDTNGVTAGWVASLGVPFLDWAYARESSSPLTHTQVLNSHAVPHTVFLGEGYYENSSQENADSVMLRRQFFGAWLSGACGSAFGDMQRYEFQTGWQSTLSRVGLAEEVVNIAFIKTLAWWKIVPNTGTGLVTAGGGTVGTTGYKPRCVASDGSFALVHVVSNTSTTIDKALMSGNFDWYWRDPTNGSTVSIGTNVANSGTQAVSTPGNNAAGDPDWLLVMVKL